ncbi:hypothetical protein EB796_014936 [Bugula neritina]|uniref:Uncharacterized protein n=1 Tax=Bugula neritina TaxID=10212 RepID=A0A7J7JLJ9_BUGNE|nr:hypothetical protein EB796_014936 [Bugula neritina]
MARIFSFKPLSEVTECHTEFNFSQQARLASTPFNSDAAPLSEFEFSSIKNTAAAPKFSSAARPSVDFAMTQHLSAISEHSHETYATSSTRLTEVVVTQQKQ